MLHGCIAQVSAAPVFQCRACHEKMTMQKFKQAIAFREQTPGFETDVVGRAFMFAQDIGLSPQTAWLQFESDAERTLVSVVVNDKLRFVVKALKRSPVFAVLWDKAFPISDRHTTDTLSFGGDHVVHFGDTYKATIHKRPRGQCIIVFRNF